MKIANKFFVLASIGLLLSGCNTSKYSYNYDDYEMKLETTIEGFKVLQLTDIHYGSSADLRYEFKYLTKLINRVNPNFIVLTGDIFMDATKEDVRKTFNFFESMQIPWSPVFGNHDKQGFYKPYFVQETLNNIHKNSQYCFYRDFKDDIYGESNYFINLTEGGITKYQFIMIDSNSYHYNGFTYDYDIIHDDQVEWYNSVVNDTTARNGHTPVPSLMFFHIPLVEFNKAVEEQGYSYANFENESGYMFEKSCPGYRDNTLFEDAKSLGSTKGIFVGHDHINSFALEYQGILLSYGVKTGDCLYHEDEHIGGQFMTLHNDGSFDLERVYQGYGDLNE